MSNTIERRKRKSWCFTLNNYSHEEYKNISSTLEGESLYAILAKEVGEKGTPHLQGYCTLKEASNFARIKDLLPQRSHIEPSRGTADHNRAYCSKEGDFVEFGKFPDTHRAKRCRDEIAGEFRTAVSGGRRSVAEFADRNPGVWIFSGSTLLRNALGVTGAVSRPDISVRWIYGAPGVGKSRYAHQEMPLAYVKDPRTKWWNGYLLEKEVIIDDFGPNGIDINHLLRWFDRYKCYVEVKGDMVPLLADKFIITSNFHPNEIFKDNLGVIHPQLPALERRCVIEDYDINKHILIYT